MTRTDLLYAARAKRHGAKHTIKTVQEARRAGIPVSWAFALNDQESGFRNIFGSDGGSILHAMPVTRERVRRLITFVRNGGVSNGVGFTQITDVHLILEAERLGGAHKVRNQLRIGYAYLATLCRGDYDHRAWHYNGAPSYQAKIAAKQRKWHKIILGR